MRMTQEMGLTPEAEKFLADNCREVPNVICPKCGEVISKKRDCYQYNKTEGMFDEEIPLYKYNLKDGSVVSDVVQVVEFSSGPCIFLCLETVGDGERIGEWSEKEIEAML